MANEPCSNCGETGTGVMVEIWGVYDGGLFFMCTACTYKWHRFPEGHDLRERAARFVDDPNWGKK